MTVGFSIDCRDEKMHGTNYWYSPEDNLCGITIYMDTVKIYLTSDQIADIMVDWKASESEVRNKLSQHVLGHKEKTDETCQN